MYGTQTIRFVLERNVVFENDVKMYGTQTNYYHAESRLWFENDVKMYGTQTIHLYLRTSDCLRMM